MSINHNWCNGYNIMDIVEHYCECLADCRRELEHLQHPPFSMARDEWQCEVQCLLNQHFGMNQATFLDFLDTMERRLTETEVLEKCQIARQKVKTT